MLFQWMVCVYCIIILCVLYIYIYIYILSGHACTDGVVGPVFCPAVCIPGCQCDDGYILDSFGGQCITIEECQGTTTTEGIDILSPFVCD